MSDITGIGKKRTSSYGGKPVSYVPTSLSESTNNSTEIKASQNQPRKIAGDVAHVDNTSQKLSVEDALAQFYSSEGYTPKKSKIQKKYRYQQENSSKNSRLKQVQDKFTHSIRSILSKSYKKNILAGYASTRVFSKQHPKKAGLVLLVIGVGVFFIFSASDSRRSSKVTEANIPASNPTAKESGNVAGAKPDYAIVAPKDNSSILDQLKYNPDKKLTTFKDTFNAVEIVISQQKLSDADATDPSLIIKVADSFQAKTKIETTKGTVYVYDKAEKQQHVAIIVFKGVLLFVQSPEYLTNTQWTTYINSLQ